MKTLCITGGNGLLGSKILSAAKEDYRIVSLDNRDRSLNPIEGMTFVQADVTDLNLVKQVIGDLECDIIINTAAFTNVDACEEDQKEAFSVNKTGAVNMAIAAKAVGARFVHLSTDYVFDGMNGPYKEDDIPNPLSVYGKSKLESELGVKKIINDAVIARTMILFGYARGGRQDFVSWLCAKLNSGEEVEIVNDQFGSPTFADELAAVLLNLLQVNAAGLFHISGSEILSRYEFAVKIAAVFDLDRSLIQETSSKSFKQIAPRPMNSGFILDKVKETTGYQFETIEHCLQKMKQQMEGAAS